MDKIIVTGGCGYIGGIFALTMAKLGYQIFIIDNFIRSARWKINFFKSFKNIKVIDACISDFSKFNHLFEQNEPFYVFHFAALKDAIESIENEQAYHHNNFDLTKNFINFIKTKNISLFVNSSTANIYDPNNQMPVNEKSDILLSNPYAKSKYDIETYLADITGPDFKSLSLRYFNPVGFSKEFSYGDFDSKSSFESNLLNALHFNEKFIMYGDCYDTVDGTCIRDFIHIDDLIDGHIKAFDYFNKTTKNHHHEIINLGSGNPVSVKQFVDKFNEISSNKIEYVIGMPRKGDIPVSYADIKKAQQIFSWEPNYSLTEICQNVYTWSELKFTILNDINPLI